MCARVCVCVCVKLTASEAYTKSYRAMMVTEIPMAGPLTAATRGLGKLMKASTNFLSGKVTGYKGLLVWTDAAIMTSSYVMI